MSPADDNENALPKFVVPGWFHPHRSCPHRTDRAERRRGHGGTRVLGDRRTGTRPARRRRSRPPRDQLRRAVPGGQPARARAAAAWPGHRGRRRHRPAEQRRGGRAHLGHRTDRPLPGAGQLSPDRTRDRLPARRLRRQGPDRARAVRPAGDQRGGRSAAGPVRGGRDRRVRTVRRARRRPARRTARRAHGRRADDLHLRHHRPAEGRPPPADRGGPAHRRRVRHVPVPRVRNPDARRRRPSGDRADVPHRGHQPRHRVAPQWPRGRPDGPLDTRGHAARIARSGSPARTSCRPCSTGCCGSPRPSGPATTSRR